MKESPLIAQSKQLIQSVRGKPLSLTDRKTLAIKLASLMIEEAQRIQTSAEKTQQQQLAGMMNDPIGKVFTTVLTDECFRSHTPCRIADQLVYVIKHFGVPSYLPPFKRFALNLFAKLGKFFAIFSVPLTIHMIQKETSNVILPGEEQPLIEHMKKRRKEGVRINLNHLGEAILGEEEAFHRLQIYIKDLERPEVEYISVKISTIFSQINLLAWQESLNILAERLRMLYKAASTNLYVKPNGESVQKFVNLDMEEYKDLHLTVALFCKVLDEPEFYKHEAGIVLQSYLPDSYLIQQELTEWAMQRVAKGGAPIKIRVVKGANLAMEQVESALRLWPQAPYTSKNEVDANYKRMINYGCKKKHAEAAHLGVASHNLFDIANALLLRSENEAEGQISFEMLEGMADHMRRVVQQLAGDMLLYCPAATKEEFQNAVAYLVRRLDENTAPENFLRQAFDLKPHSPEWIHQAELFSKACDEADQVSLLPRRHQNRLTEDFNIEHKSMFVNEPDTDWTLQHNVRWAERILNRWKNKNHSMIPLVIDGKEIINDKKFGIGEDPSVPGIMLYSYTLASEEQALNSVTAAKRAELTFSKTSVEERVELLCKIAVEMRKNRADLIGVMVADTGKTVTEADVEISEAIDFAEYYAKNIQEWSQLPDIEIKPKGTVLVTPPWNFPCSISSGGILAALATGNCVIFKPPAESVLVGWHLAQLFWKAGVSKHVLQFITCEDEPVGSCLIKDKRISTIVLTGATETAKLFLKMSPGIDLIAETGGKNTLVVSALSDRDLAIKDIIQSAFGHAGQKCSACSLVILEAEVYDDLHFRNQLRDAAASLSLGSAWSLKTKINPLITAPRGALLKGLTELEKTEEWLLEPKVHPENPQLWSPGIKLGVKPDHFTFKNELFGPVLSLVRADSIDHAFDIMNQTPYGLTAGIHSLDEREQKAWFERIEAGNCYINRTITGAIVERQPFGGCKDSGFGKGYKAGGPNYLLQFVDIEQIDMPQEHDLTPPILRELSKTLEKNPDWQFDLALWKGSLASYAHYWNHYFSHSHDPSLVRGQDNLQCYIPRKDITVRALHDDSPDAIIRIIAAAITCQTSITVSFEDAEHFQLFKKIGLPETIGLELESGEAFINKILSHKISRIRLVSKPESSLEKALGSSATHVDLSPVLANGRIELLHMLREVSLSRDYHRYGNLGERESEKRQELVN